jgi:uncharacterized protein YraI
MKSIVAVLVAGIALASSKGALAYEAYITSGGALLAGPAPNYPPVADISAGEPVQIFGCLDDYSWCDVSFQGYRGWFDGRQLAYPYQGVRVPLASVGAQVGVPLEGFPGLGPQRVHGPVHGTADRGPHLPPTPTLQPRLRDRPVYRDEGQADTQPR